VRIIGLESLSSVGLGTSLVCLTRWKRKATTGDVQTTRPLDENCAHAKRLWVIRGICRCSGENSNAMASLDSGGYATMQTA